MSDPGKVGFPELVWKKFQADFPEDGIEKFKELFYCKVSGVWTLEMRKTEVVMQELALAKREHLERRRKRQVEEEDEEEGECERKLKRQAEEEGA